MRETYRLSYRGVIFHSWTSRAGDMKPPKLIKLGSGEILEWHSTAFDPEIPGGYGRIAEYRDAEIYELNYLHTSEGVEA